MCQAFCCMWMHHLDTDLMVGTHVSYQCFVSFEEGKTAPLAECCCMVWLWWSLHIHTLKGNSALASVVCWSSVGVEGLSEFLLWISLHGPCHLWLTHYLSQHKLKCSALLDDFYLAITDSIHLKCERFVACMWGEIIFQEVMGEWEKLWPSCALWNML